MEYMIRELGFTYDDSHRVLPGLGGVVDVFDNYREASERLMQLEQKKFCGSMIGSFEPLATCADHFDKNAVFALNEYLLKEFGVELINEVEPRVSLTDLELPHNLSIAQTESIRRLSGVKFHELIEVSKDFSFWGISLESPFYDESNWLRISGNFWGLAEQPRVPNSVSWVCYNVGRIHPIDGVFLAEPIPRVFNSRKEAYNDLLKLLQIFLSDGSIVGDLHNLSERPSELTRFIKETDGLSYGEDEKIMNVQDLNLNSLSQLYELLRDMPMIVRPFPKDQLLSFGSSWEYAG